MENVAITGNVVKRKRRTFEINKGYGNVISYKDLNIATVTLPVLYHVKESVFCKFSNVSL